MTLIINNQKIIPISIRYSGKFYAITLNGELSTEFLTNNYNLAEKFVSLCLEYGTIRIEENPGITEVQDTIFYPIQDPLDISHDDYMLTELDDENNSFVIMINNTDLVTCGLDIKNEYAVKFKFPEVV